jgi:hypothetical protein
MKRIVYALFIGGIILVVLAYLVRFLYKYILVIGVLMIIGALILSIIDKQKLILALSVLTITGIIVLMYSFYYHGFGATEPNLPETINYEQNNTEINDRDIEQSPSSAYLMPVKWFISEEILHIYTDIMLNGVLTGTYSYRAQLVSENRIICKEEGMKVLYSNDDSTGMIRVELPCPDYADGTLEVMVGKHEVISASIEVEMDGRLKDFLINQ